MKKINLIIFYSVILLVICAYQTNAQTTVSLIDIQKSDIVIIKNRGTTTERRITMAVTPAGLVSAFGNPISTTTEYAEVDEVNLTVYTYSGAEFSFKGNLLVQFNITTSSYYTFRTSPIVISSNPNKFFFRVGDAVSKLQTAYPKAFNESKDGMLFFRLYSMTKRGTFPDPITFVRKDYDANFVISFDKGRGVITGFSYE